MTRQSSRTAVFVSSAAVELVKNIPDFPYEGTANIRQYRLIACRNERSCLHARDDPVEVSLVGVPGPVVQELLPSRYEVVSEFLTVAE